MSFRSPAELEISGVRHGGCFARAVRAQDLELFPPCSEARRTRRALLFSFELRALRVFAASPSFSHSHGKTCQRTAGISTIACAPTARTQSPASFAGSVTP